MQQVKDLKCLDGLIAAFGAHALLLEHLQAARRGLLGSMQGEYRSSLQFAKEAAVSIVDKSVRAETRKVLQDLLRPRTALAPAL
jgi:hypothetical protein